MADSSDDEWYDAECSESRRRLVETPSKTKGKESTSIVRGSRMRASRIEAVDQVVCAHHKDKCQRDESYKRNRGTIYLPSINLDEKFEPPVYPKTPDEEAFVKGVLSEDFLFSDLTDAEIQMLVNAMQHERVSREHQKVIIQQGDVGDFFYIVESGQVDFILDGDKNVGGCGPGGCFGELALLYDSPRAVSCVAASDTVELFKIELKTFKSLVAHHAVKQHSELKELLKKVTLFSGLSDDEFNRFVASLTPVKWKEGDRIVKKGEEGTSFYIVQEGFAKIHDIGQAEAFKDQNLSPGDWFGERALLTGEPRAANVTALTPMITMVVDRHTFESILGPLQHLMEREMRRKFLKGLPLFRKCKISDGEFSQLVDLMKETDYRKGEKLAEAGKPYDLKLWIIRHGRLIVQGNSSEGEEKSLELLSGDSFGEKSILLDPNSISSYTAVCAENLTAWLITRKDIESVLGNIGRLGALPPFKHVVDKTIQLSDLSRHRVLGRGAFGKVFLVSRKTNKGDKEETTVYALKSISKYPLVRSKMVDSVLREKKMLLLFQHPFILHLVSSFQDEKHVYLLLPIIPGGELFHLLHSQKTEHAGLPNESVVFYAACIIEALSHFHQQNIAYRDLKLENVLLDADGYCKIVDLGFAKLVPDKTFTLVGTPEYLAPEIILSKGHNKASDYWAFAVLVYELFVGTSPFYKCHSGQLEMFRRAVRMEYKIPGFVNEHARDMIGRLLVPQSKRLGNLANGCLDIKRHEWFEASSINFGSIIRKEEAAPWVPEVKDDLDASNFEDVAVEPGVFGEETLSKEEQDLFKEF